MRDLVSVIIPTYNRKDVLERALESVLNQTYKNVEIIVVDDGSTDETKDVLKKYSQIHYINQPNAGVAAARNTGVKQAQGSWISFLDSDDEWLPLKLETQLRYLHEHPDLKICYTGEEWIRNGVRVNQKIKHYKSGGFIFEECLRQCLIGPSSVLMLKTLFDEMNGFDENYPVCEDYDLWLKISSLYKIGYIDSPLIKKYGGHSDQLSTRFFAMDLWRMKSMLTIMKIRKLTPEQKTFIHKLMEEKGAILIKGFLKHNKNETVEEINELLNESRKISHE